MNSTVVDTTSSAHENVTSGPDLCRQDSKRNNVDSRFCCNICLEAVVEPVVTQCGHLYCWPCLYRWLEPGMYPEERVSLGLLRRPPTIDSSRRVCPVCKAPCSVPELVPIYVRASHETTTAAANVSTTGDREAQSTASTNDELLIDDGDEQHPTIEGGYDENEISGSLTGLRQRSRFRSRDSDLTPVVDNVDRVPNRPAAASPRASPSSTPHTPQTQNHHRSNSWMSPLSPNGGHRAASLSHGILLSFQQATSSASAVPPLHNHQRDGVHASGDPFDVANPGATEYLSRLLIMLASFVVLCLLLL